MNGNPLPPKKEVALALLERGSVHVHLDPRAAGVIVPAWFKRQPQLVLQVGLNMRPIPIPDLRVEDDRMSCTLSFNRSPFLCILPWTSIYAMVGDDARGMIWPEDVPPEVAMQGRAQAETAAKKPPERTLAVVKPAPEPAAKKPKRASRATSPKDTAHVAVVKEKKPRTKKAKVDALDAPGAPAEMTSREPEPGHVLSIPTPAPQPKPAAVRPAPVAPMPAPVAASPQATAPSPQAQGPSHVGHAPSRPSAPRPGSGKPKREIPPYLRVVK